MQNILVGAVITYTCGHERRAILDPADWPGRAWQSDLTRVDGTPRYRADVPCHECAEEMATLGAARGCAVEEDET